MHFTIELTSFIAASYEERMFSVATIAERRCKLRSPPKDRHKGNEQIEEEIRLWRNGKERKKVEERDRDHAVYDLCRKQKRRELLLEEERMLTVEPGDKEDRDPCRKDERKRREVSEEKLHARKLHVPHEKHHPQRKGEEEDIPEKQ